MMRITLICFCLGILCLPAGAAPTVGTNADVTLKGVSSSTTVYITTWGYNWHPATAGLLSIDVDGTLYNAFCIDPYEWAYGYPISYDVESLSDALGEKSQLISNILSHFSDIDTSAGSQDAIVMQLALWEVIVDDDFDLASGNFMVDNRFQSEEIVTLAQSFLVAAATGTNTEYLALTNTSIYNQIASSITRYCCPTGGQDYVIWYPVTVPAPGAILLAGLGIMLAGRLKKNRII